MVLVDEVSSFAINLDFGTDPSPHASPSQVTFSGKQNKLTSSAFVRRHVAFCQTPCSIKRASQQNITASEGKSHYLVIATGIFRKTKVHRNHYGVSSEWRTGCRLSSEGCNGLWCCSIAI